MNPFEKARASLANLIHPGGEKAMEQIRDKFNIFTGYSPQFTSYDGGIYEMAMTRAAVDAFARHCSKLKPEVLGSNNGKLKRLIQFRPNPWQTSSQFLYQVATIYMANNNVLILPILSLTGEVTGYRAVSPESMDVVSVKGEELYIVFSMDGKKMAIPYAQAGLLTRHQYKDAFLGENNHTLKPTLDLIHTQDEGIIEGIKTGATVRFAAKLSETLKDKTVKEARDRFVEDNLRMNNGGLVLYDQKFQDFRQLESKPVWIDDKQSKLIKDNVYDYFGINEAVMQNNFTEDQYNAFYEGLIEPFALQLGQVQTNMTFSDKELSYGNEIMYSANRLQYASNTTKLNISSSMLDRGVLSRNEVREIWQMPRVEGGDEYVIRGEYMSTDEVEGEEENAI